MKRATGIALDGWRMPLRRQECVLMAGGEIALGAPFEDFSVPTVSFKLTGK